MNKKKLFILFMIISILNSIFYVPKAYSPASAPIIDAVGASTKHICGAGATACISNQLTMTVPGDLIIYFVAWDTPTVPLKVFDNFGNTYKNFTGPSDGTTNIAMEIYSAVHDEYIFYSVSSSSGSLNTTIISSTAGVFIFGAILIAIQSPFRLPFLADGIVAPGPFGVVQSVLNAAMINCLGRCYKGGGGAGGGNTPNSDPNGTVIIPTSYGYAPGTGVTVFGFFSSTAYGNGLSNVGPGAGFTTLPGLSGSNVGVYGESAYKTLPLNVNVKITFSGTGAGACTPSSSTLCSFGGLFFAIDPPPVLTTNQSIAGLTITFIVLAMVIAWVGLIYITMKYVTGPFLLKLLGLFVMSVIMFFMIAVIQQSIVGNVT